LAGISGFSRTVVPKHTNASSPNPNLPSSQDWRYAVRKVQISSLMMRGVPSANNDHAATELGIIRAMITIVTF
jgi:hypothetical protein